MFNRNSLLSFAFILLGTIAAKAQSTFYLPDTSINVIAYGKQQVLPWCGGFNNPQFTMGDLNHDGLQDLVVFEPYNSVRTFINKGSAGAPNYRYAPEYALNFPPINSYLILADYNCDGIPDLFHQGSTGFAVYKGYYNFKNQLSFNFYINLFYSNDPATGSGPGNAFNNPGDIPAIVDVDNDGDLDFISYDISGGFINYFRNMRVEYGYSCDTIAINLWDKCWGRVYQSFWNTHQLAQTPDNSGLIRNPGSGNMERKTHSGNTVCLFDWDMDGDYDYLDGNISFPTLTFLQNGRIQYNPTGADTMVYQDTMWQSITGGTTVNLSIWPAAFNVDVDQDGKKDILVAPNGINSKNYNNVWYYKNFSTTGTPDWRFQSDSFFVDQSIDMGTGAYPTLFDFNKDGKPDLLVGGDGYRQASGLLRSKMSLYLNTGTVSNPAFTLQTTDFLGMFAQNFKGIAPAIGDINNDGKSDLIIGHSNGTLTYYENIAASDSVAPNWQLTELVLTDMAGDTIDVTDHAAPVIYDLDKDGKPDLVIGNVYGTLVYYRNVSTTPGSMLLKLVNTQLGQVLVDPAQVFGNYSTPFFGKIDSTGTDYLLIGSGSGNLYLYTGFQSGDTTATYTLLDPHYSFIDSTHNLYNNPGSANGIYQDLRTAPVVGDIAGNHSYEMLVGMKLGGIQLYKRQVFTEGVDNTTLENGKISVFPNPANDILNVSWSGIRQTDVQLSIINMEGQCLYSVSAPSSLTHTSIPLGSLSSGMYVCVLQSGVNRYYNKFTVIKQ